jgi:hypothetical protein
MPRTTLTPDGRELVHHSRCGGVFGPECRCPLSWPRLRGDESLSHRWSGNCWAALPPVLPPAPVGPPEPLPPCKLHNEPRGACSRCAPCSACEAGTRAREAVAGARCACGRPLDDAAILYVYGKVYHGPDGQARQDVLNTGMVRCACGTERASGPISHARP